MTFLSDYYYGFTMDGENFEAINPSMECVLQNGRRFKIKLGALTDGPSIPHLVPIERTGKKWRPAVFHDAGYRRDLLEYINGEWIEANLPKSECDDMFLELMLHNGVDIIEAHTLYEAVKLAGWEAFNEDRKNFAQASGAAQ